VKYKRLYFTLASLHVNRLTAFYADLLVRSPDRQIPDLYAEFRLPFLHFAIFYPRDREEFSNYSRSNISLCLEVENLDSAIAHLGDWGYFPSGEISVASHGREVYIRDPDGNRLILHQPQSVDVI